jgi:hypothetical protein
VALLLFVGAMAAIAWLHPDKVPLSLRSSFLSFGALFAVAALALGEQGHGWRYWARELLPVPMLPFLFLNLGHIIPLVNHHVFDQALAAADRAVLGLEAQAVLYSLPMPAWWSDLLTVAYSTFYLLPVALVVALVIRRDPTLPRVAAALVITFLVSYAGYFVMPAYGPRATVAQARYAALPAGVVGEDVRGLLDEWEKTKTDAFPSGHTMVTLAVLFCARRRLRGLYHVLLPIGTLLIAATVLLSYHYVVDVLAAVPLVAGSLALAALLAGPVPNAAAPETLPRRADSNPT